MIKLYKYLLPLNLLFAETSVAFWDGKPIKGSYSGTIRDRVTVTKNKSVPPVEGKKIDDKHLNEMMDALGFKFKIKIVSCPPNVEPGTILKQSPEAFVDTKESIVQVEVAGNR